MHEFWPQEFIWFCVQNSEFGPKFGSWWRLCKDKAEKTPISGKKIAAVISLCLAVFTVDCTTYAASFLPLLHLKRGVMTPAYFKVELRTYNKCVTNLDVTAVSYRLHTLGVPPF